MAHYAASKGGVIALTRDLAWKWARHGINVNAIAPGWFPSDMANFVIESQPELAERIPLRRFGGPCGVLSGLLARDPTGIFSNLNLGEILGSGGAC